ncbi:FG-GAP repeat domain-containing protein [Methylovulum psychrotolerans]|uniref:VCBS repeat-containing protein n=1 Tax=Methylovulum psychrotolerans TaxID=1704499 RepID=A0A2S5CI41_9GAMM|nr:VCBS repeat-containing protein [Methylovulum psychrotolerans]POZ50402.1 VCBS repeat-containing protein [Methylovulum psychrotolerans]
MLSNDSTRFRIACIFTSASLRENSGTIASGDYSTPVSQRGKLKTPVQPTVGDAPLSITASDLNNDGKTDLLTANLVDNTLSVLMGNGDGSFADKQDYPTTSFPDSALVGELNNDGKPDVAVLGAHLAISLGNGDGTFTDKTSYPISPYTNVLKMADLNNDSKTDLLAFAPNTKTLSIYLGYGNGYFMPKADLLIGTSLFGLGDINHDGKTDLVIPSGTALQVMLGKGDGQFELIQTALTLRFNSAAIELAQLNADAYTDVVLTDSLHKTVNIFLGQGDGNFVSKASYPTGNDSSGLQVADMDADGKADLLVGNRYDGNVTLLAGNGDGTFVNKASYAIFAYPSTLMVSDLNRDGKPDLVSPDSFFNNISILYNGAP